MRGTSTKSLQAAVANARNAVEQARTTLAEWSAAKAAAEAELMSLESRSGAEVLDDPAAAERLPRVMQELRDRIDIAARAYAAQEPRVTAAERAYLAAEADLAEVPVAEARAELERHRARTVELLKALEEHDGRYVPEADLFEVQRQAGYAEFSGPSVSWALPKSAELEDRVSRLEFPVLVLRTMADGRDPQPLLTERGLSPAEGYPAVVWGPDALVRAPRYDAHLQDRHRSLQALESDTIPALEQRVATIADEVRQVQDHAERTRGSGSSVAEARARLEAAQELLVAKQAEAAELRSQLENA
jgi:hypothetical protein